MTKRTSAKPRRIIPVLVNSPGMVRITGAECPKCGCESSRVVRTLKDWYGNEVERRECEHCGKTFQCPTDGAKPPSQPERREVAQSTSRNNGSAASGGAAVYQVIVCANCGSEKIRVTSTQRPIRHHKCLDCGHTFKTTERLTKSP